MARILIIDDDDSVRAMLRLALLHFGHTVTAARDGKEGLQMFWQGSVDLVITDIVMPNKEGLATVMELRRDHPTLGIIAMSGGLAHDAPLYLKLAGNFGANRTLRKPFELTELLTAIKEVLAETARDQPAS